MSKRASASQIQKSAFYSAQSHACKLLCDYLISEGYDAGLLETDLGLKLSELELEDGRVPLDRYYRLWAQAVEYTGTDDLALRLAAQNVLDGMGLVGHVFFNCKTLKQALEHYQRYYRLVNESIEVLLVETGDEAIVEYRVKEGFEYCHYEMEYSISLAAERAKYLLQSGLDIKRICFAHDKPDYADSYDLPLKCPISFSQPHAAIIFDVAYLEFKMPRNSPSLYKVLTGHLDRLLKGLAKGASVSGKVEEIVRKKMSDSNLDADYVASRLNMSRNTLYRKLKKEGFAYQDIVDAVRSEYAKRYLRSGQYSMTELAFLLGFSEVSAFSRAFKRWTGKTPVAFMKDKDSLSD